MIVSWHLTMGFRAGGFTLLFHCPVNNYVPLAAQSSFFAVPIYTKGGGMTLDFRNSPKQGGMVCPKQQCTVCVRACLPISYSLDNAERISKVKWQ